MASLFFRNLFFTILQPGIIAGLIPYLMLGDTAVRFFNQPFGVLHFAGVIIFITGFAGMLSCIVGFAVHGKGTLSPADPTKKLVVTGLYKFSRNPMYMSVMLILAGEALFFQSVSLGMYALLIFMVFHIYVLNFEEPRLRKDFGSDYERYCKKVRRWL